ncbi:transmembrane family of transporters domain-containing protein [Ditylenchus destructor]|uniref:Transmembrane family of transporters domain-containing protein n=1 Tax=Ditylenchus destructor TaxID=166010 RepID=A0AAD4NIC7_9BILA|nr:transmembrane family of transporters domain-containing protein [Ditylenchus destructor]
MLPPMLAASSNQYDQSAIWQGGLAVSIGAICFGSMHVPIQKIHSSSNGIFVQWVMSMGILIVGFAVNAIEVSPPMMPLAFLGGLIWTMANSLSQFVITGLGLGVALVLWNTTNCLTGWATGRFGLFGLNQTLPTDDTLNIVGLLIVLTGGLSFAFVTKNEPFESKADMCKDCIAEDGNAKIVVTYIILALLSGFFYAGTAIPIIYMEDHPNDFPSNSRRRNGLQYIFTHYFGIFIGSTFIFIVYALLRKNKPAVNPSLILPSLAGGMIWGIGMCCLFVSNDLLTQTVTYPVMTTVPGCVAALWSIFFLKEIHGKRNYAIICFAFLCIFIGAIFVFLSKLQF